MMFGTDGEDMDGYDTADACWEASWDDEGGKAHRVGLTVLDNCGHSDGILNTVQNIKWCVPFQFTQETQGATCPMDYFDKCFPGRQATNFAERPNCHVDGDVVGDLKVTDNAPWAKMVIGTYTESWCPDPNDKSNCAAYTSVRAGKLNHTIHWSGKGSGKFHSDGKCVNNFAKFPPNQMPDLGSCSPNAAETENRCRNAYGFPFHFDIATFENRDGTLTEPPWGKRNTHVYGVRRVQCPTAVRKAMLDSCGVPDMFIGNNLVWGNSEASWLPRHWCKTSLTECLASRLYRQATAAYLASTAHAFCHNPICAEFHRKY